MVETITGVTGTVVVMTSSILIVQITCIGVDIAGDGVSSSSIFDGSCPAVRKFETASLF